MNDSMKTIGELLAHDHNVNHWGPWRIDPTDYSVFHDAPPIPYSIPLAECANPERELFWIYLIAGKRWSPNLLPGLIACFQDVLHPDDAASWERPTQFAVDFDMVRKRIDAWVIAEHPGIGEYPYDAAE
jgi:hypothetical protein